MRQRALLAGLAVATLAAGLGVGACGGSTSPSKAPSSATASPTPSATAATPSASPSATRATAPATAGASRSVAGIPFYQPSTLVSQATGSTVLRSPDPVSKVSAYYVHVVDTGGWTTVSKTLTAGAGNLTIKRAGQGATISIARSGSGTVISISTYPTT